MNELENVYETMCRVCPVGLFKTGNDGSIIYLNQKCEDIIGTNRNELLEWDWLESIHVDDVEKVKDTYVEAIKNNEDWSYEFRFRTKDGKVTWVLGQLARVNGGGKGYVGTLTDISAKKTILSELILMKKTFAI